MPKPPKKADGQQPDNSTDAHTLRVWVEGGDPDADVFTFRFWPKGGDPDADGFAVRVPPNIRIRIGGSRGDEGRVGLAIEAKRIGDQLRVLKANQSAEWLSIWGGVIASAISSALNGRGRKPTKREAALEHYDREIAKGRPADQALKHVACEEAGCSLYTLEAALRKRARAKRDK